MKAMLIIIGLAAVLVAGCKNPGIVHLSGDTYMLSKSSAAGAFANLPKMKAEVVREANAFAASRGKIALPISSNDTFPTHGFPSVEYQFKLVDKDYTEPAKPTTSPNVEKNQIQTATLGQQLIDLQKAKDAGAITDAEYQAQKAKLLGNK